MKDSCVKKDSETEFKLLMKILEKNHNVSRVAQVKAIQLAGFKIVKQES